MPDGHRPTALAPIATDSMLPALRPPAEPPPTRATVCFTDIPPGSIISGALYSPTLPDAASSDHTDSESNEVSISLRAISNDRPNCGTTAGFWDSFGQRLLG